MKTTAILMASAFAGSAFAGVHKMSLKKVPLHEQLVSFHHTFYFVFGSLKPNSANSVASCESQTQNDITTQMKHLGQKYLGIRPDKMEKEMFKTQDFDMTGGHVVPINVSFCDTHNSQHNFLGVGNEAIG